jgi:hypothetical protein
MEYCSDAVSGEALARSVIVFFRSRRDLLLENFALFWAILRRFWSHWKQALILVQPET